MFAYIKGVLAFFNPSQAIVDVHGVGYLLFIPCRLLGQLPQIGEPVQFYTTYVVREFSHTLYGFLSCQERDIFEILMNVTGIGPKMALSLIGHLSMSELQIAVMRQDLSTLCRVPGVGKKTAERLIVELKDKLAAIGHLDTSDHIEPLTQDPKSKSVQDAMLALINLGYNQTTAQKAIKQGMKELPEEIDLAQLITVALKHV
ncbi:Holliday junction ATP-dependent DNA helicase RuvA [Candidatus Protochlamydia amoebophila]|uniref:Holliday junction branch migration protein RuvA n=1 Tax=Candidatus Protochlamydia amoebophila TaxID=362787 RepID=UPI001BC91122|nr:Holliday junction branch migration protein RuvA [Candidatus Protochlamydia amoebophila]MBS4164162.1 Holliday junction ATP-dependent DNA helicase RuvA [Candidatus Protochlamydia amoebophila]